MARLEDVLTTVVRGRVAYLETPPGARGAFADTDARIALDVLRHLLGARPVTAPERFPLTELAFQAVARRLGYRVGQKHARRLVARLAAGGVVVDAGSYRQPYRDSAVRSGFRVRLYRLWWRVRSPLSKRKRPVGSATVSRVKPRRRWWSHPLFGDLSGRPPPQFTPRTAARMQSLDELKLSPR
jgi:hypothetical protein